MYYDKYTVLFVLFFISFYNVYAQENIDEERKRSLLNSIRPPIRIENQNLKGKKTTLGVESSGKVINKDNIAEKTLQYRDGGARFDDPLSTNGLNTSLGSFDLFKMEQITDYKMVISNGKFNFIKKSSTNFQLDNISQKQRLRDGIMIEATAGGLNLSGFKERKTDV